MSSYNSLLAAVQISSPSKLGYAIECEAAFKPMNNWLRDINIASTNISSSALVAGALSASIETVSTTYLGLARHAIISIRTYYELSLSWLYYKDHIVEWNKIVYDNDQASLPSEIQKYLRNYFTRYEPRWSALNKNKTRAWDDPYKIMSTFVHGNILSKMPNATKPEDIIASDDVVKQLPKFVAGVCEYISDAYVSAFVSNWESLPAAIRVDLQVRLGTSAKAILEFS